MQAARGNVISSLIEMSSLGTTIMTGVGIYDHGCNRTIYVVGV